MVIVVTKVKSRRKPSRKPYKSHPHICSISPTLGLVHVDGWTYINQRTADHYINIKLGDGRFITIKTRESR